MTFRSNSDHLICRGCQRHQGATRHSLELRDRDHLDLWQSALKVEQEDRVEERHAAQLAAEQQNQRLAQLSAEVLDLQGAVKDGLKAQPVASVERWLQNEAVSAATAERDRSYRSRDHALSVLLQLDWLHREHDERDGFCSCGKRATQCKEWQIIEEIRPFLHTWEERQVERARQGLDHGLSVDHPEARRGWRRRIG
jgi:hypothetical protein